MPRHRIDTFKLPAATVHGGTGLVGTGYLLEQLMAAPGAFGVLLHDLTEELGDVIQPGILCIADVLTVIMPDLQGVVLH